MEAAQLRSLGGRLKAALHLSAEPIGIGFGEAPPDGLAPFGAPLADPGPDGRTGAVPAGCVFWMHGTQRSFSTLPADHGNCSVGSMTHGISTLEEVASNSDVAELIGSGWVNTEAVAGIPTISQRPGAISYGPLSEAAFPADVVLIRVNGRQLMVLSDAVADLDIQGKPQCHIIAMAKEHGKVAASTGCALSRARTGMQPAEMTCAIPIGRLAETVEAVEVTNAVDSQVAKYAAADARRFGTPG